MVSIYVSMTITGVILIFIAVYNASAELEVIQKINNFHNYGTSLLQKKVKTNELLLTTKQLDKLAFELQTDDYRVTAFWEEAGIEIDNINFSSLELDDSKINENGGQLISHDNIYIWSWIHVPGSQHRLIITQRFRPGGLRDLFLVYKNRLIIPAAFFIWMTVWGSLILSNLVRQINQKKEEAEMLALQDPLTGLPNRRQLYNKLKELAPYSRRYGNSFCIAVIDLDEFKSINDSYGHETGDELLRQVAVRFKKEIRNYDLVARTGGDEFVLLFPDSDSELSKELYQRIHSILTEPYLIFGNSLTIGASLGYSVFPCHSEDADELLIMADKAMYLAKRRQSDIVSYSEVLDEK